MSEISHFSEWNLFKDAKIVNDNFISGVALTVLSLSNT